MSSDKQLNYVNNLQNRDQKLYYVDDASELNSINLKENDKIYAINDNKLFQMEIADQEEELSGPIVSFNGRNNTKIKSLVANIKPQQDLHGYGSPWPAGGGKNLVPMTTLDDIKAHNTSGTWNGADYSRNGITFTVLTDNAGNVLGFKLNGTSTAGTSLQVKGTDAFTLAAGSYYYTGVSKSNGGYDLNLRKAGTTTDIVQRGNAVTLNLEEDTSFFSMYIWVNSGKTITNAYVYPMIRNSTVSDATFAPYSNECPISGHTGMTVARTGKNLLDSNTIHLLNSTATIQRYGVSFNKPGVFTIKANKNTGSEYIGAKVISADGTFGSAMYIVSNGTADAPKTVTLSEGETLIIYNINDATAQATKSIFDSYDIQVELGSTASTYEAYTGTTIPITFPETIYGGSDEVIGGVLESTMGMVDLGTLTYVKSSTIQNGFVATGGMPVNFPVAPSPQALPNWLCSQYKVYTNNGIEAAGVDGAIAWRVAGASQGVIIRDSNYAEYYTNNDMTAFKAAMSGVQLCYELATPVEYTLDGEELTTLYGTNNIWSDIGDITVKIAEKGITAFELKPYN